ncbi:unnamed protein product [Hydatigera taeniaeformis]|uniref:Kinesin motor domain-containing protein n=1 Tax=Hydatigena taeniaeformis TaxID=6205 RepID=A0A3P7HBA0_HYDTA|nr:unnamed protein product [Hydatigera taeniaeformis]
MYASWRVIFGYAYPITPYTLGEDDHLPGPAPSTYLRDTSPIHNTQFVSSTNGNNNNSPAAKLSQTMDKLTEIRAPTAGHAAHLLDVALANRAQNVAISHTLFTLHVYQYKVERNGLETEVSGGRSRLQLLYLGCGRYGSKEIGQGQDQNSTMKSLSLANMANVLLGLLTGQRQLPHRESAVTQLLREGMTGNHAQPCIIAHASGQQQHYAETLQVVQLASRLHRLRRRRVGSSGGSSAGGSSWTTTVGGTTSDSSTSSRGLRSRLSVRPRLGRSSFGTSTTDYTSSSEQSCAGDTVIYLGGGASETGSSLGPRGLADGSVVHSVDELKKYASSGEEGTLQRSLAAGKTCLGRSASHSEGIGTLRSGGLIKRVTPRTNATAWPRAAAVRKGKEVVNSTEETWVDGPKAMVTKGQQSASCNTSKVTGSETTPPPAPPYFGFTHHIVPQNTLQRLDMPKVFVATQEPTAAEVAPAEVTIKEPTYASIDEMKSCTSNDGSLVESCSSSSSSSDGGDDINEKNVMIGFGGTGGSGAGEAGVGGGGGGGSVGGRGFGVLSDISERTEETEGGTSAPSSTAGGGHEEHENPLLDLAIQQSSLVHEDGKEIVGGLHNAPFCASHLELVPPLVTDPVAHDDTEATVQDANADITTAITRQPAPSVHGTRAHYHFYRSLQRRNESQQTSSVSPVPVFIQRTVSFPWMPTQMSQSSTAHPSPCQPPPPTQPFWSPVYSPQLAPMQYYPWSLPTSPYLQSSMQAWSTQLPLPSSAASDFSQTALPLQYTCVGLQRDLVEEDTPARTSSSPASAPPQETKKSKNFTLPSILCTLRRWHARRKERRSKKGSATASIEKGAAVEAEEGVGGSTSAMTIPLRTTSSLPGAYSRTNFPRAPSSDRGIGRTPQQSHYYPSVTPSLQNPILRETSRMCAGDPSTFMNQMHQSLSTYRT